MPGAVVACRGDVAEFCTSDGRVDRTENCGAAGQQCVPGLGCAACRPGSFRCDGQDLMRCADDGSGFSLQESCGAGTTCNTISGSCVDACAEAAESNSYLGCEYWAVPTLNSQVAPEFSYALVVANPQATDVEVTVTQGGRTVRTATVPAGGLQTLELPWVDALKGAFSEEASTLARGAAYKLVSTAPVTVYQFNPLDYRISRDCAYEREAPPGVFDPTDGQCFSFSNDASLLLPVHVLRGDYIGIARPTMMMERSDLLGGTSTTESPGYLTIVGAGEGMVDVRVTFGGDVVASSDGSVSAYRQGQEATFQLGPGDVLQLVGAAPTSCGSGPTDMAGLGTIRYCRVGARYDLTGTRIAASGPVAVFGGHNCAFVPFNRWACDHLEEQLFPLESWGKEFVVSATRPLRSEPNLVRIVSGDDGNEITFEPASVHAPVTLGAGEVLEFESGEHFVVRGSKALSVAQFLVGQDYAGYGTSGDMAEGDPAMSLAIPSEQYRNEYIFLAPESFPTNFVNVVAPDGATVTLDGNPVTGFRALGSTGWQVAQVSIPAGSHRIEGSDGFGIVVYGFGTYTSYMYPGGLDLKVINPIL